MADEPTTTDANGGQPTPEPTPPAAPAQPTTPAQPAATPTAQPTPDKTFTQADLDRVVKERLERERSKYADYDSLKKAASRLEELEAEKLTEQEKLQKRLEKLEQQTRDAEARAAEKEQFATTTLIRSAVVSEAAKLNFANPEDAYMLLNKTAIKLNDGGEVEGVAEAVATLAESRPYLLKAQGNQQRIPATEPFNPSTPAAPIRETDDQRRQRMFNRTADLFPTSAEEASKRGGGVVWSKSDNQ